MKRLVTLALALALALFAASAGARPSGSWSYNSSGRNGGSWQGFSPVWIQGLKGWYRADLGITIATGVSSWADQSGTGGIGAATQATGNRQPTYSTSGWTNGGSAISFPGTANIQLSTASTSYGAFTIVTAFKLTGTAGELIVHNSDTSAGDYLYGSTGNTMRVNRGGTESDKNLSSNWAVSNVVKAVAWVFDGTHAGNVLYVNGVSQTLTNGTSTGAPGTGTQTGAVFIGASQSGTLPVNGLLREVIIYNVALSAADITRLHQYQQATSATP